MSAIIGEKIRALRKKKGLTINDMANEVGVTSGYISQIERDLIEPSLTVLRKLSKVLDTPIPLIFASEYSSDIVVINADERKNAKLKEENLEYEFLTPAKLNNGISPKIEMLKGILSAKSWDNKDNVTHEYGEYSLVLSGKLEYHVDEKAYALSVGDGIYVPEGTPHSVYNPGDEKAEFFLTMSQG